MEIYGGVVKWTTFACFSDQFSFPRIRTPAPLRPSFSVFFSRCFVSPCAYSLSLSPNLNLFVCLLICSSSAQGYACCHPGIVRHGGQRVERGVRYLAVAFVDVAGQLELDRALANEVDLGSYFKVFRQAQPPLQHNLSSLFFNAFHSRARACNFHGTNLSSFSPFCARTLRRFCCCLGF